MSQTPDLVQHTAIAPHITGSRVLSIDKSLRSSPFHRNLSPMGHIVIIVNQIPRHSKVAYLRNNYNNHDFIIIIK